MASSAKRTTVCSLWTAEVTQQFVAFVACTAAIYYDIEDSGSGCEGLQYFVGESGAAATQVWAAPSSLSQQDEYDGVTTPRVS